MIMEQGIVSEFDARGGFGIIDTEDGRIVFFNKSNLEQPDVAAIDIGTHVQFKWHEAQLGPHAHLVRPCTQSAP